MRCNALEEVYEACIKESIHTQFPELEQTVLDYYGISSMEKH